MSLILETRILLYGILFVGLVGIISRVRISFACRKLLKEAENAGSSSHDLLMLIKKKYENSIMVNHEIRNTEVFVEKYLRKYQVGGMTLRRLGTVNYEMMICALILGCVGCVGAFYEDMSLELLILYPTAAFLMVMVLLFFQTFLETDSRIELVRLNMVDYLENTMQNRMTLLEEMPERERREAATGSEAMELKFQWNTPQEEELVRQVVEEYFS